MPLDLYNIHQEAEKSGLILNYHGNVSESIVTALLELFRLRLESEPITRGKRKSIFNILIECLQNITFHGTCINSRRGVKKCVVYVCGDKEKYQIITGNYIAKDIQPHLEGKIKELNELDIKQLRLRYLETLEEGIISDKGGAGLGLMRIMKESGHSIGFDFRSISDNEAFFQMKITVNIHAEANK